MEQIGEIIKRLCRETSTLPPQTITYKYPQDDPNFEATIEGRRENLRQSLNVSSLDNTLDNFHPEKGAVKAIKAFRALASGRTDWKMLMVYGGVGNGKTHLLEGLVIELYKAGAFCRLITYDRMMSYLRSCMDKDSNRSVDEVMLRWCREERLVIDDVGTGGSDSKWSMKMLEEIIMARYRGNLFTVLSTNVDLVELPERVVSRFNDPEKARLVQNEAPDYRPKKGKK